MILYSQTEAKKNSNIKKIVQIPGESKDFTMTLIIANQYFYRRLTSIEDYDSSDMNNIEERNCYLEIINNNNNNKPKTTINNPSPSTNNSLHANGQNNNNNNLKVNNVIKNRSGTSVNININHITQDQTCSSLTNTNNITFQKKQSLNPFNSNSKVTSHRSGNLLQLPSQKTERSSINGGGGTSFLCVSGLLSQFSERTNLSFISNDKIKKIPASEREMPKVVEDKIKEIFSNLFIFSIFPDETLIEILSNLIIIEITKGDYLYERGSETKCFYIVMEGILEEFDKDNKSIKYYKEWEYLGYESLINKNYYAKNEGNVKCIENASLYVLRGETFLMIRQKLIKMKLQERFELLNNIIFFKSLDCVIKHLLAEQLEFVEIEEGEKILSKGSDDINIYFINTGSVVYMNGDKEIKTLRMNSYVGLLEILLQIDIEDVITCERSTFFKLKEKDLRYVLGENYINDILFSLFKKYIQCNLYFSELINETNNKAIFSKFKLETYDKYEKINTKNLNLKRLIIILDGNFIEENTTQIHYSTGSVIGHDIITTHSTIPTYLCAYPKCVTFEVELKDIIDLLGKEFELNTISSREKEVIMQKIYFFNLLSKELLTNIVDDIIIERFSPGETIIEEGTCSQKFYIIIKGTVQIAKSSKQTRILEKQSTFGEFALMNNINHTATVTAMSNTICYVLTKEIFDLIINEDKVKEYFKHKEAMQNDELQLSSFQLVKHLGRGKFGLVSLIHNHNYIYAIKAISRNEADRKKRFASYLICERRIMLSLDHPFIVKIVKSFKNEFFVFLLLEYVNGICLKELINQQILFTLGDTRFYIANILLAIDYMHKKKIVHRDIKPNNIMINSNGYLKLIDFGTAKFVKSYTHTIIGTPHYIAPEILLGKGYSFSVDFWSLGVCAFELFYHKFPFGYQATDVMKVYTDIMCTNFKFPVENINFATFNELIEKLLNKQVSKRYCSLEKVKTLEFFNGFKWDELYEMKIDSPYVPNTIDYNTFDFECYTSNYEDIINVEGQNRINSHAVKDGSVDCEWANEF